MTKVATNKFTDGLTMDTNPLVTMDTSLSNCLNGTIITFDGNEQTLQNDSGNTLVKDENGNPIQISRYVTEEYQEAKKDENGQDIVDNFGNVIMETKTRQVWREYTILGVKEYNGVLYIVSKNDNNEFEIGSYPSPPKNTKSLKEEYIDVEYPKTFLEKNTYKVNKVVPVLRGGEQIYIDLKGLINSQNKNESELGIKVLDIKNSLFNIEAQLILNHSYKNITKYLYDESKYTLKSNEYGYLQYQITVNMLTNVFIRGLSKSNDKLKITICLPFINKDQFYSNIKLMLGNDIYTNPEKQYINDFIALSYYIDKDTDVKSYSLIYTYESIDYTIFSQSVTINKSVVISDFAITLFKYSYSKTLEGTTVDINFQITCDYNTEDNIIYVQIFDTDNKLKIYEPIKINKSDQIQNINKKIKCTNLISDQFYICTFRDKENNLIDIQYIITQTSNLELNYNIFRQDINNDYYQTGRITSANWNVYDTETYFINNTNNKTYVNYIEYTSDLHAKKRIKLQCNNTLNYGYELLKLNSKDPTISNLLLNNCTFDKELTNIKYDSKTKSFEFDVDITNITFTHNIHKCTKFKNIFPDYDTNEITILFKRVNEDYKYYINGQYNDIYNGVEKINNEEFSELEDVIYYLNNTLFNNFQFQSIIKINIDSDNLYFKIFDGSNNSKYKTVFIYKYNNNDNYYFLDRLTSFFNENNKYVYYQEFDKKIGVDIIDNWNFDARLVSGEITDPGQINDETTLNKIYNIIQDNTSSTEYINDICKRKDIIQNYDLSDKIDELPIIEDNLFYVQYEDIIKINSTGDETEPIRYVSFQDIDQDIVVDQDMSKSWINIGKLYYITIQQSKPIYFSFNDADTEIIDVSVIKET